MTIHLVAVIFICKVYADDLVIVIAGVAHALILIVRTPNLTEWSFLLHFENKYKQAIN